MTSAAHADRLNFYQDFPVGATFLHHWGRTVTQSDAIAFATQTHQYQPALFNVVYAAHLGHPSCPVSELLVYAIVLGLSVEDLSESGGAFLGADDIALHEPLYVGDTLVSRSEVVACRESGSRPGWGVVTWRTAGFNQRGERVITFVRSSLVKKRLPPTTSTLAADGSPNQEVAPT